ncbi:MAG: hypothetical protein U0793_13610 [Gemmataceae bacterium]
MSQPGNGKPLSYRVVLSGTLQERTHELHERARLLGLADDFLASLKALVTRLKASPQEVGEPLYRAAALGMIIHAVIRPPLVMHFAIHETLPIVWITKLDLL